VSCEEARELISAYLDGELAEEAVSPLLKHVEGCDACRALLRDLSLTIRHTSAAERFVPRGDMRDDIMALVERESLYGPAVQEKEAGRWSRIVTLAVVAAAVLVFAFGVSIVYLNHASGPRRSLRAALKSDMDKNRAQVEMQERITVAQAEPPAAAIQNAPAAAAAPAKAEPEGGGAKLGETDVSVMKPTAAPGETLGLNVRQSGEEAPREQLDRKVQAEAAPLESNEQPSDGARRQAVLPERQRGAASGVVAASAPGSPQLADRLKDEKNVLAGQVGKDKMAKGTGGGDEYRYAAPADGRMGGAKVADPIAHGVQMAISGELAGAAEALNAAADSKTLSAGDAESCRALAAELLRAKGIKVGLVEIPATLAARERPGTRAPLFLAVVASSEAAGFRAALGDEMGKPAESSVAGRSVWTYSNVEESRIRGLFARMNRQLYAQAKEQAAKTKEKAVEGPASRAVVSEFGVAASRPSAQPTLIVVFEKAPEEEKK